MSAKTIQLLPGKFYHIYNRGNNREDLFRENDNYYHFLRLYENYIEPVAKTYAWVLLRNHFHLMIQVKELQDLPGFRNLEGLENPPRNPVSQAFANLFNAYTKAFNKRYSRTGSLFQKNFRRISVENEAHLRRLIIYIHTNPTHHGFTDDYKNYPWSSYGSILSLKPTRLHRNEVLGWFNDEADFVEAHRLQ